MRSHRTSPSGKENDTNKEGTISTKTNMFAVINRHSLRSSGSGYTVGTLMFPSGLLEGTLYPHAEGKRTTSTNCTGRECDKPQALSIVSIEV